MSVNEFRSYVGGAWRGGEDHAFDLNPARPEEVVAEAQRADAALAYEATKAAERAVRGCATQLPPPVGR